MYSFSTPSKRLKHNSGCEEPQDLLSVLTEDAAKLAESSHDNEDKEETSEQSVLSPIKNRNIKKKVLEKKPGMLIDQDYGIM